MGFGVGSIDHAVIYVDAYFEEDGEVVPCDAEGREGLDGLAADPVYVHDCLDDRPDVRVAWDKAVEGKRSWFDYEADHFCDVSDFL